VRFHSLPPTGDWEHKGACRGYPPEIFVFDKTGMRQTEIEAREAQAKRICATCPVLEQCRTYAREHKPDGIWGGETPVERRKLRSAVRSLIGERQVRCPVCLSRNVQNGLCLGCGRSGIGS
jgi:WhiB family redox-sensing transcriptional regulator